MPSQIPHFNQHTPNIIFQVHFGGKDGPRNFRDAYQLSKERKWNNRLLAFAI